MAALTIRNIDDDVKLALRRRAAEHGVSMEQEARDALRRDLGLTGRKRRKPSIKELEVIEMTPAEPFDLKKVGRDVGGRSHLAAFVVDTSALICLLGNETEARPFRVALHAADAVFISIATLFEASCVVRSKRFSEGTPRLNQLRVALDLDYVAFDEEQMLTAREGYARYGRGSGHRAGLNMGECFSYALAKSRNLPLLFKGDDFIHTDIQTALRPA